MLSFDSFKNIIFKQMNSTLTTGTNPNERVLILQDLSFNSKMKSRLDVYYLGNPIDPVQIRNGCVRPVLVFIHGGAWTSGSKKVYRIMARSLVTLGYMVVIPDYIKFPKGSGTDMIHDVTMAIQWTIQNIRLVRDLGLRFFICLVRRRS
jgi:acetyl esterase/lipase